MTAEKRIRALWAEYPDYSSWRMQRIPNGLQVMAEINDCLGPDEHVADKHKPLFLAWHSRTTEIGRKGYSRIRDENRAYRQNDLRFARLVDAERTL